ncbi:cobyrinate a,c-diamide synthase [Fundidesulfovibrio agrisoli]|uniref:cobyrinate a,c-diamide synthase n=1 Tax=Fundidesulfovibrio agrisoli TaxID=2922717 RepID=UPI001FACA592|nr:cobyrinate a,c-diamide synthase [Fundidesulfovibrio agrisoli]
MISIPRLVLAGLSGGSGKTIVSLGLTRAWVNQGLRVAPFKKGPDYIDAAWLSLSARTPACNLDPFLFPDDVLLGLFAQKAAQADLAFVEGNRGLFDGGDALGSYSTSQLARKLAAQLVLVIDATKMTRTAAAIVQGCANFEPDSGLAGVILNRTAGERHRRILREAIEQYTDVPVLGTLPKLRENPIPERHMGLISNREYQGQEAILKGIAQVMADNCDLPRLLEIARGAPPMPATDEDIWPVRAEGPAPRIGYVLDAALWFYYQENLEALRRAGAELVEVSLLSSEPWPELDGLYLGGGFPETQAQALADNIPVRSRVRALSESGAPIYAECGGFMYLCEELHTEGAIYPMAGVFPLATTLCARPQGLGYAEATVVARNPFHPVGAVLRGHEFHYSKCLAQSRYTGHGESPVLALRMERGSGMLDGMDGAVSGNTFAAYTHIHALGVPHWAENFVRAAAAFRDGRAG